MKQLIDFPNYTVTKEGRILSKNGKPLNQHPNKNVKYFQVSLWKNNKGSTYYVHRLVAKAFVDNSYNLPEVNHIDGDRHNNHYSNLEWVDSSGNSQHAVDTGLRTYTNRLTQSQFEECLDKVINGMSYQELSNTVPYKVPYLSTKLRKIARQLSKEHLLNDSLDRQKIERALRNLESINKKQVQRLFRKEVHLK